MRTIDNQLGLGLTRPTRSPLPELTRSHRPCPHGCDPGDEGPERFRIKPLEDRHDGHPHDSQDYEEQHRASRSGRAVRVAVSRHLDTTHECIAHEILEVLPPGNAFLFGCHSPLRFLGRPFLWWSIEGPRSCRPRRPAKELIDRSSRDTDVVELPLDQVVTSKPLSHSASLAVSRLSKEAVGSRPCRRSWTGCEAFRLHGLADRPGREAITSYAPEASPRSPGN